jgi:hypothetical protein
VIAASGRYWVGVAAKDVSPGDVLLWPPMQRGEQSTVEEVLTVRVGQRGDSIVIRTESRTQSCAPDELLQVEFSDFGEA